MSEAGNFEHLQNFLNFCEAEIVFAGLEQTKNMISAKLVEADTNDIDNID